MPIIIACRAGEIYKTTNLLFNVNKFVYSNNRFFIKYDNVIGCYGWFKSCSRDRLTQGRCHRYLFQRIYLLFAWFLGARDLLQNVQLFFYILLTRFALKVKSKSRPRCFLAAETVREYRYTQVDNDIAVIILSNVSVLKETVVGKNESVVKIKRNFQQF